MMKSLNSVVKAWTHVLLTFSLHWEEMTPSIFPDYIKADNVDLNMKNKRTGWLLSYGSKLQNLIGRSRMKQSSYSLVSVSVDCYGQYHSTDGINYEWFYKVIIDDSLSSLNPALTYKEQEESEC
jgi:hypothetical protein